MGYCIIQYLDQVNGHWETVPRLFRSKGEASRARDRSGVLITEKYDDVRIVRADSSRCR